MILKLTFNTLSGILTGTVVTALLDSSSAIIIITIAGDLIGAFVTLIIQSSSVTVGVAIILSKKGLLGLGGGIAVMLGAELGTCNDSLLDAMKGSRQALKRAYFI